MSKLKRILAVSTSRDSALELVAGAKELAEEAVLVFAGPEEELVNADRVYFVRSCQSFVYAVNAIAKLCDELSPELIMLEANADGRLAAGVLAAKYSCSTLADCASLTLNDGKVCASRMVYGGKAFRTIKSLSKVTVACINSGCFEKAEYEAPQNVKYIDAPADERISFVSRKDKQVQQLNLAAAKKIVGVGRGIKNAEKLQKAIDFAKLIGAEIGCTRPVAEEDKLLPRERYIGVSGCFTKPDLYLALGISGQIQHTVGVNGAKTIIAVNQDKNAAIFKQCDYGIVGDIEETLTALSDFLNK